MDIVGAILGTFFGMILFYVFADILVRVPGYFIYCTLFTKAEYDPDHLREVDIESIKVAATGVIFWLVLVAGAYGVYRLAT
jgi:hypothetical protein